MIIDSLLQTILITNPDAIGYLLILRGDIIYKVTIKAVVIVQTIRRHTRIVVVQSGDLEWLLITQDICFYGKGSVFIICLLMNAIFFQNLAQRPMILFPFY